MWTYACGHVGRGLHAWVCERNEGRSEMKIVWVATRLRDCWVIRPKGSLGTCGFYPVPWTAWYTKRLPKGMEVPDGL